MASQNVLEAVAEIGSACYRERDMLRDALAALVPVVESINGDLSEKAWRALEDARQALVQAGGPNAQAKWARAQVAEANESVSAPLERRVRRLVPTREERSMKIRTRFFSAYSMPGGGWFRLFGAGLGWKDTRRISLSFSERNGYKKHLMLGAWSFAVLWPRNA